MLSRHGVEGAGGRDGAARTDAQRAGRVAGMARWLMLLLLAPAWAQATHSIVGVPTGNACTDENVAPWEGGATPSTPGLWANAKRGAVGWDLLFSDDKQSLKLFIYTYDGNGRPTWLASRMTAISADPAGATWQARFYKYTASTPSGTEVGSAAIRFMPDDPTKVAVAWDWDELRPVSAPVQQECLHDFVTVPGNAYATSGDTTDVPATDAPVVGYAGSLVNQLFSGYWNANGSADGVPGLYVNVLQNTEVIPTSFVEADYLVTYDAAGEPVWLLADMDTSSAGCSSPTSPCSPPGMNNSGRLDYVEPLQCTAQVTTNCFHHSPPTENCSGTNCAVQGGWTVWPYQQVGTITRAITDGATGKHATYTTTITNTTPTSHWSAPQQTLASSTSGSLTKTTNSIGIRPVQLSCNARNSSRACYIYVPWNAGGGTARPWRFDLSHGTYLSLSNAGNGEVYDYLHAGDRFRYELWDGNPTAGGSLVDQSAEVRAIGYPPGNGDSNSGAAATPPAPTAFSEPSLDVASDLVGTIAADFRVDEGGNANYRIPLAMPPGSGGVAPALALSYNSSNGMGYFGTGFALDGLSAITPCRPGKEFGDTDVPTGVASVFCLDGQRLLLQSGTDRAAGAIYRTEIESFQKVVIQSVDTITVGGVGTPSFTFKVYGKDGSVRTYGGTAGSIGSVCPTCANTPVVIGWMQTSLADAMGNTVTFNYSALANTGERYLDTVVYGGGQVKFNYALQGGTDLAFSNLRSGSATRLGASSRGRIVTSIDVSNATGLFRHYALAYTDPFSLGTGQVRPRLSSLRECADLGGTQCYPATTFDWTDEDLSVQVHGRDDAGPPSSASFQDIAGYKLGDFNGDHRSDILWIDIHDVLRVNYASATAANGVDFSAATTVLTMSSGLNRNALWEVFDLDADGRDDLLYAEVTGSNLQWYVRYALASGGFGPKQALASVTQSLFSLDEGSGTTTSAAGASALADFNGDGLPDLLYIGPGAGSYRVALLNKPASSGAPFAFSPAINATFLDTTGAACNISAAALGKEDASRTDAIDLDGDGRSDLSFVVDSAFPCGAANVALPAMQVQNAGSGLGTDENTSTDVTLKDFRLKTFRSLGQQGSSFVFQMYDWLNVNISLRDETAGLVLGRLRLVDLNGDGLVDVAYRGDMNYTGDHAWRYMLAGSGTTLTCINGCTLWSSEHGDGSSDDHNVIDSQVQLQDLDGDGKPDLWWPSRGTDYHSANPYQVFLWKGSGFHPTPVVTGFDAGGFTDWMRSGGDFDGDGIPEQMKIKPGSGGWYVERTTGHHAPRNVIAAFTNGFGAATQVAYAPLTFASVYQRDYDAPWLNAARGSVVFDVVNAGTVVQYVTSSTPSYTYPADTGVVQYFYKGQKVQAGGRGALGFRRVSSYDYQTAMEVDNTYRTTFPTSGAPTSTITRYVQSFPVDPCLTDPDSNACMARSTQCAGGLTTTCDTDLPSALQTIRTVNDIWMWRVQPATPVDGHLGVLGVNPALPASGASTAARANVFLTRTSSTVSTKDYNGIAMSSESTSFDSSQFDDLGNPGRSTVTKSGGGVTLTTTTKFTYANDVANWKLGRLLTTSAVNARSTGATNARRSTFTYESHGLLASEKVEGMNGSAVDALSVDTTAKGTVTYYGYDARGNKVGVFTCSATIAEATCRGLSGGGGGYQFHPADQHGITRYVKTDYDSLGRYANAVHEGFSSGGSASIDRIASQVTSRNAGGDVLEAVDANGVVTRSRYGVMGRKRFSWTATGASSRVDYALCTASTCPTNMALAYVETTTTTGAPKVKVFYDLLGRETIKVTTGFANESIAVMTAYDNRGNPYRTTQPFFAQDSGAHANAPMSGVTVAWNRAAFDGLGRVANRYTPENAVILYTYEGLKTTTTMPANGSGQVQTKVEIKDATGALVSATDANNLTVTYTYDGYGQLTDIVRPSGTTHTTYDTLGRRVATSDPDAGAWTFQVDDAGQVYTQSSPRNMCTKTEYDARGRVWRRTDYSNAACTAVDTQAQWDFDTASYGIGKLALEQNAVNGITRVTRTPQYDGYSRAVMVTSALDGKTYIDQSSYDQYGRPFQTFFTATGAPTTGELYEYNAYGYQSRLRSAYPATNSIVYYEALAMDAYGHVTDEYRSSMAQMLTERSYDPKTGRLLTIQSGGGLTQDLTYTYDVLGNMTSRHDTTASMNYGDGRDLLEMFAYDRMQRLLTSTVTTGLMLPPSLSMTYDNEGNILSRSVGGASSTYAYGAANANCSGVIGAGTPGPHAVTRVGASTYYCYDAAGNVIRTTDNGVRTLAYTPYDLPSTITGGNGKVGFEYGPNREKLRRLDYASAGATSATDVTHYVGSAEIHVVSGAISEVRRYLGAVLLVQRKTGSTYTVERQYLLTDAQGSTSAVLTEWGEPVNTNASMSFDPFGARRDTTSGQLMPWSPSLQGDLDASTHHGYTGHEQVDKVGIIHMNGRIYDPSLGRFLQADPFVQDTTNSQSLNRYSYVLNNPMAFTDPTGYWGHKQQGYLRMAVAIVISVWTGGAAAGLAAEGAWAQAMAVAFAGGFAAGAIQSGTGKGALIGGVTAMVFTGINGYYGGVAKANNGLSSAEYAERALANGAAGGILASIQGQRFGSGFASAGLSAALNPAVDSITSNPYGQGFAAAIVGGTVSEATGGKFANGAITAAFAHAVSIASGRSNQEGALEDEMRKAATFNADDAIAFESPGYLRTTVPGQIAWDNAVTSWEDGSYGYAALHASAMLGEQILYAATLGQSSAAIMAPRMAVVSEGAAGHITGYTRHGLNQAISRDGVGVSPVAILEAVRNPLKVIQQISGTIRFQGPTATVILNQEGKVVSTWARSSEAWR